MKEVEIIPFGMSLKDWDEVRNKAQIDIFNNASKRNTIKKSKTCHKTKSFSI